MAISMNRILSHTAWASAKTITHLQSLPEDALAAYAKNPKWRVAEIIPIPALTRPGDLWAFEVETYV